MKKEQKGKIIKIIIVLLAIAAFSVGLYFILKACGVADINKIRDLITSTGPLAIVVFIALRVTATIFLSFVPACSMTFDLLSVAVFGNYIDQYGKGGLLLVFAIDFASVIITSIVLDLVGRFGGAKAIEKIVGKEDYQQAQSLIQEKGMVYVPVMYLLPIFPDDAICMVCGATKLKFWIHLIEIVVCRGIGCFTAVFGVDLIPKDILSFTNPNPIAYIRIAVIIISLLLLLFYIVRKIDIWLTRRLKNKKGLQ